MKYIRHTDKLLHIDTELFGGEYNKCYSISMALVERMSVGGEEGCLCFLYHNWDGEADLSEGSFLADVS